MANTFERTQYEQEVTEEATDKVVSVKDTVQETVEHASQSDVAEVQRPLMDKDEERKIRQDRMRFVTNKLSSGLAILAILLNVFYFVSIYRSNANFYYSIDIGISVLLNLLFMLAVFLCSEGVKNYNKSYSIALIVIGVIELARIFFLPLSAHNATVTDAAGVTSKIMSDAQFARVTIYLACAAALLLASGIIGVIRSVKLAAYKKTLDEKPA